MKSYIHQNKLWIFVIYLIISSLAAVSCIKREIIPTPLSNISVANMIVGGSKVQIGTYRNILNVYGVDKFNFVSGEAHISAISLSTPTSLILDSTKMLGEGGLYSLFFCGQGSNVSHIWVEEKQPLRYKDSVFGIRFVNLSPNSKPLNVTVAADSKTNLFYQLNYKDVPSIIQRSALMSTPTSSITFQVRDATNDAILATLALSATSLNTIRFKTITVIIKGLQGTTTGVDALGLALLTHY